MDEKEMQVLIQKSEDLQRAIRIAAKHIDNPVLTTSIVIELENFIDYLKETE
ncbi:hypothetical protein PUS82_00195 [Cytobacillus firmus]|uniref:hypothetical protein n=1 Tax=Cytobacillus firmus TaxID=1399 RepID=UPI00237AA0C6|nr:hypothetical protein [Cytobacillus firmus]MDD9309751.1 hypothetical protein [Cytobacillus firmus]